MPAAPVTEAQMTRALKAWLGLGLVVGGMTVEKDGTIKITAPVASNTESAQPATPKKWAGR